MLLVGALSALAPMTTWCRWPGLVLINRTSTRDIKQEAIKQLKERGEKVTTFVVIAVAKQVFSSHDYLSAIYVDMKYVLSLNAVDQMY